MKDGKFFEVFGQSSDYTSRKVVPGGSAYSLSVIIEGSFNVDLKLQSSMDGEEWVDIDKTTLTGLSDAKEVTQYDVNLGNHRFVKVVITHNSGTFSARGYIK